MSTFSAPPPSGGSTATPGTLGRAGTLAGGDTSKPLDGKVVDDHSKEAPPAPHPTRDAMGRPADRPVIPTITGSGSITPIAPPVPRQP